MTGSEFLALVDERWSDGRWYPTLEDYGRALAEVRRRETPTTLRVKDVRGERTVPFRVVVQGDLARIQVRLTEDGQHVARDVWLGPR